MQFNFYNWWPTENKNICDFWFKNFFTECEKTWNFNDINPNVNIYTVFGSKDVIKNSITNNKTVNLFFNGENTEVLFTDYCNEYNISKYVDCVLTFNKSNQTNERNKILRFPLWLIYWDFYKNGLPVVNTNLSDKLDKAVIIVSHDNNRIRNIAAAKLNFFGIDVDSNTEIIVCSNKIKIGKTVSDKLETLKKYKYNICCENSVNKNYITEKCFQSLICGCIPIYYGPDSVEEKVLYQDNIVNVKNVDSSLLNKNFDVNKVWKENALLYIYTAYLKLWSIIVKKCGGSVNKDVETVVYNIESLESGKEVLYNHWKQYKHFCLPRAVFKVVTNAESNTKYYMEDFADILTDYIL